MSRRAIALLVIPFPVAWGLLLIALLADKDVASPSRHVYAEEFAFGSVAVFALVFVGVFLLRSRHHLSERARLKAAEDRFVAEAARAGVAPGQLSIGTDATQGAL